MKRDSLMVRRVDTLDLHGILLVRKRKWKGIDKRGKKRYGGRGSVSGRNYAGKERFDDRRRGEHTREVERERELVDESGIWL